MLPAKNNGVVISGKLELNKMWITLGHVVELRQTVVFCGFSSFGKELSSPGKWQHLDSDRANCGNRAPVSS
jgi:hypothetical protein